MPYFSLYWKRHYNEVPPAGNAHLLDVDERVYDVQWMLDKGLRPAGIDDDGNKIWVSPSGMVYYAKDLKKINDSSNDSKTNQSENKTDNNEWRKYIPNNKTPGTNDLNSGILQKYSVHPDVINPQPVTSKTDVTSKGDILDASDVLSNINDSGASGRSYSSQGIDREIKRYLDLKFDESDFPSERSDEENNQNVPKHKGKGTRVFKWGDTDYERPRYVHMDGRRDVFICFKGALNIVVDILKKNPGDDIFLRDALYEYGGFYNLDFYETFAKFYMDEKKAEYCSHRKMFIKDIYDTRLGGKPWIPSAEAISRLSVVGSVICVTGKVIQQDEMKYPDVNECDHKPLWDQGERPLLGGKWTEMTIHIHPIGAKNVGAIDQFPSFSWKYKSNNKSDFFTGIGGPSSGDLNLQRLQELQSKRYKYRSIVVDRSYIYLYRGYIGMVTSSYDGLDLNTKYFMKIKRKYPDKRY